MLKGEFDSDCSRFRTESPAFWGAAFTCNSPCAVDAAKELPAPPTSILPAVSAFTTASAGQSRREQSSLLRSLRQPPKIGIWNRKCPPLPAFACAWRICPDRPIALGQTRFWKSFHSRIWRPFDRGRVPAALGRARVLIAPNRGEGWLFAGGSAEERPVRLVTSCSPVSGVLPANRAGKCCEEGVGRSNE
jgi:hypothetical protein